MLYILVNNNYQIDDFERYYSSLSLDNEKPVLIRVPHTLNLEGSYLERYSKIFTFFSPFQGIRSLSRYCHIKKVMADVSNIIKPKAEDVLVFFTDFEVLNQYIVHHFRQVGSKVIMLEDGMATVAVGNLSLSSLPLKDRIQKWVLRNLYGLFYLNFVTEKDSSSLPVIDDHYIDAIGLSIKAPLKRNIMVYQLASNELLISRLNESAILFINQDLYKIFKNISFNKYLEFLQIVFSHLSKRFNIIYFKFHPRETRDARMAIKNMASAFSCIEFISDFETPIERQVEELSPAYSASFYSNSLKSLFFRGIEPFFLYHLLPELKDSQIGKTMTEYLKHLRYRFVQGLEEIKPGYKSGIQLGDSMVSLPELIQIERNK